jgi:D-psicose/D-tagatose/L-ribulose 3-epimerase
MKLAISNIAWTNEEEPMVAKKLKELGVKFVEIAPTKMWEDPTTATEKEIMDYKDFWLAYGIEVVAFQSMLFRRADLKIFDNPENRQESLEYLKKFIRLAGDFGSRVMVYGSPKNRQKNEISSSEADKIATKFFKELGDYAEKKDVDFCIEPNPTAYNCDFIVNAKEGMDIVRGVSSPGFGLHLDIAGMALAGDDVAQCIIDAGQQLKHFHISSPYLEQVEDRADVEHRAAAAALKDIKYSRFVSIEMRPDDSGQNVARVEKAVRFAQEIYSS